MAINTGPLKRLVLDIYDREVHAFTAPEARQPLPDGWSAGAFTANRWLFQNPEFPGELFAQTLLTHVQTMKEWFVYSGIQNKKTPPGFIEASCKQTIQQLRKRNIAVPIAADGKTARENMIEHIFQTAWGKATAAEKLEILRLSRSVDPAKFAGWGEYSIARRFLFHVADFTTYALNTFIAQIITILIGAILSGKCREYVKPQVARCFVFLERLITSHCHPLMIDLSKKITQVYQRITFSIMVLVAGFGLALYKVNQAYIHSQGLKNSLLKIFSLWTLTDKYILQLPSTICDKIANLVFSIITGGRRSIVGIASEKISARNAALIHDGSLTAYACWEQMDINTFDQQKSNAEPLGER